ncbi:MAG: methyltransferase domain-containing protein [Thermoanaerobaculia bacterium]|nr:methyltransferase domain-containing protein [Thermoanaerobaculia bacterium]
MDSLRERIRRAELERVRHLVAPPLRGLELGGGNGFQAKILHEWGNHVTSVDVVVPDQQLHYPVQPFDGRTLPFPSESFDVVFSSKVLEHDSASALPSRVAATRLKRRSVRLTRHVETPRICVLDVWLPTFLGSLLAFSYVSSRASAPYEWIHWPGSVSLFAVSISLVVLEIAVRRLHTPQTVIGSRRLLLYFAALIIGVILDYAVMVEAMGPRSFRVGVFLIFGLPLFVWLFGHIHYHHRYGTSAGGKVAQIVVFVSACLLLAFFVAATVLTGAA